jgi:hypothetical protein
MMTFKRAFEEQRGFHHIGKRAGEEVSQEHANIRYNLDSRHFAAVISQGKLRLDGCSIKDEAVTIAVEGVFRKFEGMCFASEVGFCCENVFIRVVVRDTGRNKVLIVTAFPLRSENIDPTTPEVNYEDVWS